MSRSRRKHPIFGNANADSEASDKRIWHSRMRHRERQALHSADDYDAHLTTIRDDVSRTGSPIFLRPIAREPPRGSPNAAERPTGSARRSSGG